MADQSFIISSGSTVSSEPGDKRLSNSDFRQFLTTSRSATQEDDEAETMEEMAKKRAKAKKHQNYQRWVQKKAKIDELNSKPKYRDRAKERRKGLNPDYEGVQEEFKNSDIKLDASKNKYLGGDVKHTHLVKGLDYQLLQRVRDKADHADDVDDERLEREIRQQEIKHKEATEQQNKQGEVTFVTAFGRSIYRAAMESAVQSTTPVTHFRPGRMLYQFDLNPWEYDTIPTTLIQPQDEVSQGENKMSGMVDGLISRRIAKILTLMRVGSGGSRKKKRKKKKRTEEATAMMDDEDLEAEKTMQAVPVPPPKPVIDDDEDMFGGSGDNSQGISLHDAQSSYQYFAEEEQGEPNKKAAASAPKPAAAAVASQRSSADMGRQQKKTLDRAMHEEDDYYAEAYPSEYSYVIDDDSDEDLSKMDQGRRGDKARPWDFKSEKDWEDHNAKKEATPKAAFQFGLKMKDGRNTKRLNKKQRKADPAKEAQMQQMRFEREFQAIQSIIKKREASKPKRAKAAGGRAMSKRQKILEGFQR